MTGNQKFYAIFWIAICIAFVGINFARHEGCIAICINNASTGGN